MMKKEYDVSEELYRYYSEQFKKQEIDRSDPNKLQIEKAYTKLLEK